MKLNQLLEILSSMNPEADVEVLYCGATWSFNGEYSEEVDQVRWGSCDGAQQDADEKTVKIFAQEEDLRDVF